jgi:hypothetical protein
MMAERGIDLARTPILCWIQRYIPEFGQRWNRFARKAGRSWQVDEIGSFKPSATRLDKASGRSQEDAPSAARKGMENT